jgi:hypothetical protein
MVARGPPQRRLTVAHQNRPSAVVLVDRFAQRGDAGEPLPAFDRIGAN